MKRAIESEIIARWESARGKFYLELSTGKEGLYSKHGDVFDLQSSSFNKFIFAANVAEAIAEAGRHVDMVDTGRNKNPIQRTI